MRSTFSIALRALFGGMALLAGWVSAQAPRPNIVILLADDLGWGDVGFQGQEHIRTPHLDALAKSGLVFRQHYAGASVCMPSRGCLLTGRDTGTGTIRGNPRWTASGDPVDLRAEDVTITEELKRAGYRTAIIGKWGMSEGDSGTGLPWNQGFDYFYGYLRHADAHSQYPRHLWRNRSRVPLPENDPEAATGRYAPDLIAKDALRYLDEADPETPFFLFLSFNLPHFELTVPEESKDPYRALGWPERKMARGHYRHDPAGNLAYAGMVSRLDAQVGQVLAKLHERGLDRDTLVLFSSDNGPEFERTDAWFNSNGPFRGGKQDLYEGGLRVPFVAAWPGVIEPGATEHVSAFWDWLPTLCDLAGIRPQTRDLRGLSFAPELLGMSDRQREHPFLYWEFNEFHGPMQALREGDWKVVVRDGHPPELYDLANDPGEQHDLAAARRSQLQRLLSTLSQARTPAPEFPLIKRKIAPPRR